MSDLARDFRLAARGLRRTPGFTAAAVLTLAFGMVAAIAVFSVIDAVLLRPLPYRDAGIAAALVLGRFVAGALHGVSPYDVQTYLTATGAALLAGLAACWLPAARAARVAPAEVLRDE